MHVRKPLNYVKVKLGKRVNVEVKVGLNIIVKVPVKTDVKLSLIMQ
jgi:hypothetical protein